MSSLLKHHPKSKTPGKGRPPTDEGPLLRSCVVLAYSAWEVYVEESLIWAVDQWMSWKQPQDLPETLRTLVAKKIATPWDLCEDGWKQCTIRVVSEIVQGNGINTFGLNTAGPDQVIKLHREILAEDLLSKVRWQRASNKYVKASLAELVEVRGEIAHKGTTPGRLSLGGARSWQTFVSRLGSRLDQHLVATAGGDRRGRAMGGPSPDVSE